MRTDCGSGGEGSLCTWKIQTRVSAPLRIYIKSQSDKPHFCSPTMPFLKIEDVVSSKRKLSAGFSSRGWNKVGQKCCFVERRKIKARFTNTSGEVEVRKETVSSYLFPASRRRAGWDELTLTAATAIALSREANSWGLEFKKCWNFKSMVCRMASPTHRQSNCSCSGRCQTCISYSGLMTFQQYADCRLPEWIQGNCGEPRELNT